MLLEAYPPIESNLLAFYGINIGEFDINTAQLWLRLESAKAAGGWQTTIYEAAITPLVESELVLAGNSTIRSQKVDTNGFNKM